LLAFIDRLLPKAGRNRADLTSQLFDTFMLTLHDGGSCMGMVICAPARPFPEFFAALNQ